MPKMCVTPSTASWRAIASPPVIVSVRGSLVVMARCSLAWLSGGRIVRGRAGRAELGA